MLQLERFADDLRFPSEIGRVLFDQSSLLGCRLDTNDLLGPCKDIQVGGLPRTRTNVQDGLADERKWREIVSLPFSPLPQHRDCLLRGQLQADIVVRDDGVAIDGLQTPTSAVNEN